MKSAVSIAVCLAGYAFCAPGLAERLPYLPLYDDPFSLEYESEGAFDEFYLLESARDAEMQQDWPRALFSFTELHRMNPDRPDYLFSMARMAFLLNRSEDVLRWLDQLPAESTTRDAYMLKAGSLLLLGRYDESIAFFRIILEEEPESLAAKRGLAEALLAVQQFEEAAGIIKEILEADPGALDQHQELKTALLTPGTRGPERWAHILKVYAQTKTITALFSPVDAATISFEHTDRDKAIEVLLKAIEENPESAVLHSRLGMFYNYMGQKDLARKHMDMAYELSPDDLTVVNNRGVLAMQFGHDEQAIAAFKRAVELKPDYSVAFRNLSRIYYIREEWKEAAYSAQQSLIMDQDSLTARLLVGFSFYKLGYFDDVLRYIEPILTEDMDRPSVWFLAGISAHRLGRWPEAERCYRKGLSFKDDYVLGLNNLADLLVSNPKSDSDDIREAMALATKASELTRQKVERIEATRQLVRERAAAMGIVE